MQTPTRLLTAWVMLALATTGCQTQPDLVLQPSSKTPVAQARQASDNADLIAYKQSAHKLYFGYWRTWYDQAEEGDNAYPAMSDVPDKMDLVFVFPGAPITTTGFWPTLKNTYIPALHAKGTKVVYSNGFGADFMQSNAYSHDQAGYAAFAKHIMDDVINYFGFDGLDLDFENVEFEADRIGLIKAFGAYLGPQSGSSKLLIYDTNLEASNTIFSTMHSYFSYVLLQAYGRSVTNINTNFNAYTQKIAPTQFLAGFSFNEGNTSDWGDVGFNNDGTSGRGYDYARWAATAGAGGVFGYALDRDRQDANGVAPDDWTSSHILAYLNPN